MAILTREEARRIEQESGLARGTMSYGRERSIEEDIYLSVPPNPMLAVHVDLCAGPALVIFEQVIGMETKSYLLGAEHATGEDAARDIANTWGGLVTSRQQGLFDFLEEEVSVVFTGFTDVGQGQRWSWSVAPSNIRSIFSCAPNSMWAAPQFPGPPGGGNGWAAIK